MKKAIVAAVALGFVGAAFFYLPLLGGREIPYLCPVCPHIDSFGNPIAKFGARTSALGALNALLFLALMLVLVALRKVVRKIVNG